MLILFLVLFGFQYYLPIISFFLIWNSSSALFILYKHRIIFPNTKRKAMTIKIVLYLFFFFP